MTTIGNAPSTRIRPALAVAVMLTALLFAVRASAQCAVPYEQKLAAPDPSTNRWFGDAIALDGNVAFIGSQFDDYLCPEDPQCNAGSVQVFAFGGGTWTPTQRLVASAPEANAFFGKSIAVRGSHALVGAYGHETDAGVHAGQVYDFRFQGGQWVEHRIIEASDAVGGSPFGWQVAVEGTVAAIGARDRNSHARGAESTPVPASRSRPNARGSGATGPPHRPRPLHRDPRRRLRPR